MTDAADRAAMLKAQVNRFFELVPPETDLLLAVLKAHLLIEEHLHATIVAWVRFPKPLEHARFTFSQRLRLAQAIAGRLMMPFVWEAVEELNNVRNKLVHRAEPGSIGNLLRKFVRICDSSEKLQSIFKGPRPKEISYTYLAMVTAMVAVTPEVIRILANPQHNNAAAVH